MPDLKYALRLRRLRKNKNRRLTLLLLAGGAVVIWFGVAFYQHFMPIVTRLAEADANNIVSAIVNNAIADNIAEGKLKYSDIIQLEKNESGAVTAIVADVGRINMMKAEITADVINAFSDDIGAEISIPIGNLSGIKLLSGKGPSLPIKIVSAAKVNTEFVNNFTSAGINQTCHQIIVRVTTGINMLIPGKNVFYEMSAEVAVAETVIIGEVPESYTFFEADEKWDESLEQYDILS